jgi:hypothetical protein
MADVSGQALVDFAQQFLGTPYRWGGNSLSSGIDCSGLVQQVYKHFGISLPRVTYQQITQGASVPTDKLRVGDLVFFDTEPKKGADHVGIYIGGGKFIHAPHTGDVVKISSLADSYYMNRLMAVRRISGVDAAADAALSAGGAGVAPAPIVKLSADELADRYGMSYAFFRSQPELMRLLKQATSDQCTPEVFTAHLKNTTWWEKHSESVRKAQVQAKTDPATYKASLAAAAEQAREAAVKAGAILTSAQVQALAKNMVTLEWDDAQVQDFLGRYVDFTDTHTLGGQAGAAARQLTQYAYDQGVKVSDQTVKNRAAYVVRGIATMQDAQDELRQQAVSTYPGYADQLMGGITMRDIAQPYIQMTAQTLGLPESEVDVWHPKVQQALNRADSKGLPAPMGLSDYQSLLRADPAWRRTPAAQAQTTQVGRQVLAALGLTGAA